MSETPDDNPAPPEDVAEQRRSAVPPDDQPETQHERPWDADPADASEQDLEVPIDEDEWR